MIPYVILDVTVRLQSDMYEIQDMVLSGLGVTRKSS